MDLYICNLETNQMKIGEKLLKKNVSVKKKLVKENDHVKFSGLIIILLSKYPTLGQKDIKEAQKQYELYKTLNPRYSEIVIPLKEAKLKVDSSDLIYSSNYNIFRSW